LMLEPFVKQLQFLLKNMSLKNVQAIEPTELDALLANFLKFRDPGSKSTGVIELFYTTPMNLDIPKGTIATDAAGNTYVTTRPYYIPSSTMSANVWQYPYYSTGPIAVESSLPGVITEIGPNEIVAIDLSPVPAIVTNPAGFTGGTDAETNTDFLLRAMTEVINGSLGSAAGIENTLISTFPTIQDIQVKGMGDEEMLRDLVASGVSYYPYPTKIDFYGKVSGLHDLPYPGSKAYWTVFWDNPATSGIQPDLPLLEEIAVDEFLTPQYAGIYKLDDAAYTKFNTQVIAEDRFAGDTIPAHWRMSDAKHGLEVVASAVEFAVEQKGAGNKLRLGYRTTEVEVPTRPIQVDVQFLLNVMNGFKLATAMAPEVSHNQPYAYSYSDVPNIDIYIKETINTAS